MPGTINVSVLEFKDLPSSSPPSSISVKYSPLTTLRDNVSITLQDSQGTEISRKGVQTMLVVEKGSWDEFLPLEGGGQVHLKLQFVLNEEERNRIRRMRESALRKKGGEIPSSSSKWSENVSSAGGIVTSSLPINYEVSDSRKRVIPKAMSVGHLPTHAETLSSPECTAQTKEENVHHKRLNPNDQDDQLEQNPLEKTPSNVRKMISAFEGSLAKDTRPVTKPPVADVQADKRGMEASKDLKSKIMAKPVNPTPGRLKNPFLTGELQQVHTHARKREEHIDETLPKRKSSGNAGSLKEPSSRQIQVKETESTAKHEMGKPNEDLVRLSTAEAATVFGSSHKEHLSTNEQDTVVTNRRGSRVHTHLRNSLETSMQRTLEDQLKAATLCENELSSESSGAWIFPDHTKLLCMTTGSKQIMELVGVPGIQERTHKGRKSFPLSEKVEKFGNYNHVTKGDESPHVHRKSEPESTVGVENSTGPIGQAIKVAIMVAFGILVLLTRQRKP